MYLENLVAVILIPNVDKAIACSEEVLLKQPESPCLMLS